MIYFLYICRKIICMNLLNISVEKALETLVNKGVILYPTDTVWGIGGDATSCEVASKIFRIKNRAESKSFILLVSDIQMLKRYINVNEQVIDFLKQQKRPTSVVYENPIGLASNVIAPDNTVAIRIVQNEFCQRLISKFNKPIISTSANMSGFPTPISFQAIAPEIKNAVDYIVPYEQNQTSTATASQLVKVAPNGEIIYLRQ